MNDKLQIEYIPTIEIKPYPKNPRKNDKAVEIVAKSIKEYGFNVPILLDKNNEIIAGHTRLKASQKLGLQEVPVIWLENLSEEQVNAFRIMDNKTQEYADWDLELLKTELEGLKELEFDLEKTGFNENELNKLILNDLEEKPLPEPSNPKYNVKLGDVYQLGNHRLMCGDCTIKENVDKLMNGEKAILMVTDPPYGINYNPEEYRNHSKAHGRVLNDHRADWYDAWKLFYGDVCYVYHASRFQSIVEDNLKKAGFIVRSQIIWVKSNLAISFANYKWKHEPIFYAIRENKSPKFYGTLNESTVWEIQGINSFGSKEDTRTMHSTQKPLECMKRPIRNSSKEKEGVYDPFGGSGSTLIACEQTNRKCYMMELDEKYCSVIIERWENLTNQKAIKI